MGKLKELIANANFNIEDVTISRAEARRILHQLSTSQKNEGEAINKPQLSLPQHIG